VYERRIMDRVSGIVYDRYFSTTMLYLGLQAQFIPQNLLVRLDLLKVKSISLLHIKDFYLSPDIKGSLYYKEWYQRMKVTTLMVSFCT
jgi:hypothetical protein